MTAASLFDGHDAAINVMRRLIQAQGAEVIHLGHNRSVEEVVQAALQEDADAIALSSYQGGHVEYFKYMIDMLRERGAGHVRVFGGGGGTITPEEIADLEAYGVERIYHPNDGMKLGLVAMIEDVVARTRAAADARDRTASGGVVAASPDDEIALGGVLSALEQQRLDDSTLAALRTAWAGGRRRAVSIGITGTGGAGKSSVVDELLQRFLQAFPDMHIAVIAVDPTRRRSGGALLGDRIRMNALRSPRAFMRSMATRRQNAATSAVLTDAIAFLAASGFDLVIVETAGIGQSDSEIVDLVDFPVYVMTSEYGAPSQLEKIDMLDFAELVVLNKYDKRSAEDALRDVRKQWKRNRVAFSRRDEDVPVYPTIASQFNDPGLTWMFVNLCRLLREKRDLPPEAWTPAVDASEKESRATVLIPGARTRYLAEIAEQGRAINDDVARQTEAAAAAQACWEALGIVDEARRPPALERYPAAALADDAEPVLQRLRQRYHDALDALSNEALDLLRTWPERRDGVTRDRYVYQVRGRAVEGDNYVESLSHQAIPKIAVPASRSWSDLPRFLMRENLPGADPYTGGVYPYRRAGEDPTRMFAGEGTPERTNRRFHYLSAGQKAARLSTAFDSVTLYGEDPHPRPDIYGKVGNSGVSIATLDDMKKLYSGFDLSAPTTSVSMTINGPAPILLAMFMNTAIDQNVESYSAPTPSAGGRRRRGSTPTSRTGRGRACRGAPRRQRRSRPGAARGHGRSGRRSRGLRAHRRRDAAGGAGTVQADILKEDQAQNTCIFSTEFALRMMGDIQQHFVDHEVRNFYWCRSPAITSPRPAPTRSASSPSRWPTASPSSSITWRAAWPSTTSRPTCRSSSATAWTRAR